MQCANTRVAAAGYRHQFPRRVEQGSGRFWDDEDVDTDDSKDTNHGANSGPT